MTTNIDEHYPSALTDLLVVGDTPRDGVISNLKEVRVKCTWVKRPVCLCTHPPLRLPCVCPSSGSFPCLFIRLSFCAHVWMSSPQLVWPSNLTCLPLTDWLWPTEYLLASSRRSVSKAKRDSSGGVKKRERELSRVVQWIRPKPPSFFHSSTAYYFVHL